MRLNRICLFAFILCFVISCLHKKNTTIEVHLDKTKLLEGDLVFRMGRSTSSQIVNLADKAHSFSHIGIVIKDSLNNWHVLHAVPGESDESDGIETLKCDPILQFFNNDRTVRGIVVRFDSIQNLSGQIVEKAKIFYNQKLLFDHNYTLSDSSALYCTEFIHRIFLSVGIDLSEGRRHTFPLVKEPLIFPSDILKNKALHEICEVHFEEKTTK